MNERCTRKSTEQPIAATVDPLAQEWLVDENADGDEPVIYVERQLASGETYAHVLFEADWGEREHAEHIAKLHNAWLAKRKEAGLV